MSGNLWMFSDKLDDEDIEIMKHEFITYYQGADYYGLGLKMFTRLAHEAGAVYKIGKKVLIRRTIFDEYLRQQYHIEQMASLAADGKEASTRQGTLVLDTDSGRMNIRFGLHGWQILLLPLHQGERIPQHRAWWLDVQPHQCR